MPKPTLVVLAAGIGSRYGGLKQIEPVGPHGEIILDYSIYDALVAGFGRVVFVISAAIEEAFRERVGRTIEAQCETAYVIQRLEDLPQGFEVPLGRQKPWGTAHATWACRDAVSTPFTVINADDFYGRSAFEALTHHLRKAQDTDTAYDYCMVGYSLENTLTDHGHVARGVCSIDEAGYLLEIHERTRIEKQGRVARYGDGRGNWTEIPIDSDVSMNCWGFTPSLFSELEARFHRFLRENSRGTREAEFFLPEVIGQLVQEGRARVKVLSSKERWFGVTYPQDMAWARREIRVLIRDGVYPEALWARTG
jgi:dTDP-glucose pyrophosphorylase